MKEDDKMVVKRRFERINKMTACKSCIRSEDIPKNNETFTYGFKHNKIDEVDN